LNVFPGSLRSLVRKVENALHEDSIDLALRLVHGFVERIITEPICTAQVFASHDLDQLCLRIGRQTLSQSRQFSSGPLMDCQGRPIVVYLVSRLQRSGGHSRLVQDLIRAQPEKSHLILSTEVGGPSDNEYFATIFPSLAHVRFLRAPSGDFRTRLTWVQSTLIASQPGHVCLLNHHQDSVAVAALVPELELEGTFYHHGDHHLCLGVHADHLIHVDLHPMGYHYCRDELGLENRYVPLTFEDKDTLPLESNFMQGGPLTTATAARFNKVEIPYYVSYVDTVPHLLRITGGKHLHIGTLTPWARYRIHRGLSKLGVPKDRFVYLEWTPSVWTTLQQYAVDIYIASFPYGAGLTLIEAMGAGIPVVMHEHMYSRVLSGLELAYEGAFRWSDPNDLFTYLAALQPETLAREKRLSRLHYEKFHRPEILQSYLREPNSFHLPVPPLKSGYKPRYDEWAAWAEGHLNLSNLIHRTAYRGWRGLRRKLR
jgi:hypothetical protein